jgi:hypothetical protein
MALNSFGALEFGVNRSSRRGCGSYNYCRNLFQNYKSYFRRVIRRTFSGLKKNPVSTVPLVSMKRFAQIKWKLGHVAIIYQRLFLCLLVRGTFRQFSNKFSEGAGAGCTRGFVRATSLRPVGGDVSCALRLYLQSVSLTRYLRRSKPRPIEVRGHGEAFCSRGFILGRSP